jgi:hypothetical protein
MLTNHKPLTAGAVPALDPGMASMGSAGLAAGCIAFLASSSFIACEGSKFAASGTGGAGGQDAPAEEGGAPGAAAGNPASTGGSGVGGDASSGGTGEAGMAAGGAPVESCTTSADCRAARFCQQGSCVACDTLVDIAELEYGNPQPLDVINSTAAQDHLRFARPGPGKGLIYVRDFFGGHLWFTSDPSKSAGAAITVGEGVVEYGGLYVPQALPAPFAGYNFFFHRAESASADVTRLFAAKLDDTGAVSGTEELPAPLNDPNAVDSYSIALAKNRVVWTRNIDGQLDVHLMTLALPFGDAEPVELRLPMPFECGFATEFEYAPWLTPDGATLFFTARALNESCEVTADTPTLLYVIALSAAGEPQGVARALSGLAADGVRQTDPALSADACQLFYSAQTETGVGLFRAERLK